MRRAMAIIGLAILAGCGETETTRNIDAMIDADFTTGEALITCRASSTGTCHGVFLTEGVRDTAAVKQGETSSLSGLGPRTHYCLDVRAPDPEACRPRPLADGQQIVRSTTVKGK